MTVATAAEPAPNPSSRQTIGVLYLFLPAEGDDTLAYSGCCLGTIYTGKRLSPSSLQGVRLAGDVLCTGMLHWAAPLGYKTALLDWLSRIWHGERVICICAAAVK